MSTDWTAEGPLTEETLLAAIEKIRNAPVRVCGVTEPHVVHPKASGWVMCANCFGLVLVTPSALHANRNETLEETT